VLNYGGARSLVAHPPRQNANQTSLFHQKRHGFPPGRALLGETRAKVAMVNGNAPIRRRKLEQSAAKRVGKRVSYAGFPKMALLAYLIMVACLMTSIFVGFEWVATSTPRFTTARPIHTATHTRLPNKSELAGDPSARSSLAQDDPNPANLNQVVVSSEDERARERRREARARHHRLRIMAQRWNRPMLGQTALGYTAEPIAAGRDRTD
jgi:hypothetical protein